MTIRPSTTTNPIPTSTSKPTETKASSATFTVNPTPENTATSTQMAIVAPTVTQALATETTVVQQTQKLPYGGGVSLSSTEWYQPGWNLEPPLTVIQVLADWGTVYVRIPISQRTWLNKEEYRSYIDSYVVEITKLGMYVVADLHWSDRADATLPDDDAKQQMMPDANSVNFWKQFAVKYKGQENVIFEIYNEPHSVSPEIWLNGGATPDNYQAVGMQEIVDAIRSTGSTNWLIVNGLDYGFDHRGLQRLQGDRIAYGTHIYALKDYHHKDSPEEWEAAFGFLAQEGAPLIISEMGDLEKCDGVFYQSVIDYAKERQIPWIAWAAYPAEKPCEYPALISDWLGNTTPAGAVVKNNLVLK